MRVVLALLLGLVACLGAFVDCGTTSCPFTAVSDLPTTVRFESSCGFNSFSSTCAMSSVQSFSIVAAKTETCDVAFVLGDGTTHQAHLSLTERPPIQKCGGPSFSLSAIIDGRATGELSGDRPVVHGGFLFSFGSDTDAGPATCKPDAGTDASGPLDGSDGAADDSG